MAQFVNSSPLIDNHIKAHNVYADVVSMFGADPTGVTSSTTQIQAAVDSGATVVFFPTGTYTLADGTSISLSHHNQRLVGAGRTYSGGTTITSKNAYAFKSIASGNLVDVTIEGFNLVLRTGATSGGGIKMRSNDYMAGCLIRDIEVSASGDGLSTEAGIWLSGWIGSYVKHFRVSNVGGNGLFMDSSGFVCNQWSIQHGSFDSCSLADRTHSGLYVGNGGSKGLIQDNNFESIKGYGVRIDGGGQAHSIMSNWFENNWNTNVWISDVASANIQGNSFQEPHNPQEVNCRHIRFSESIPTRRNAHQVRGNFFFGPYNAVGPDTNTVLEIESGVTHCTIGGNWGMVKNPAVVGVPNIIDNGTNNAWLPNDGYTGGPDVWSIPGTIDRMRVLPYRTAAASGGSLTSAEAIFYATNATGTNYVMMGSRGYLIFCTGSTLTSSDELANGSFAFFWDNAAGKIKARVRDNSGTYSTLDVTP